MRRISRREAERLWGRLPPDVDVASWQATLNLYFRRGRPLRWCPRLNEVAAQRARALLANPCVTHYGAGAVAEVYGVDIININIVRRFAPLHFEPMTRYNFYGYYKGLIPQPYCSRVVEIVGKVDVCRMGCNVVVEPGYVIVFSNSC